MSKTTMPETVTDASRKTEVIIADLKVANQDLAKIRANIRRDINGRPHDIDGRVLNTAITEAVLLIRIAIERLEIGAVRMEDYR
jgi:hypothetical protein